MKLQDGVHDRLLQHTYINERVHDRHSLRGNTSIRVYLLQDLVDVDLVGLGLQI